MANNGFSKYDLDIPSPPEWEVMDATKLKCLMSCERMFFFEYVLGWRQESSIHLSYGTHVHQALHEIALSGKSPFSLDLRDFIKSYYQGVPKVTLSQIVELYVQASQNEILQKFWYSFPSKEYWDANKNPVKGILSLFLFCQEPMTEWKMLEGQPMVELGGQIVLSEDMVLSYRLDGFGKLPNGNWGGVEYKTGAASQNWESQWETDLQVTLYSLVGYEATGKLGGLAVKGLLVNKSTLDDTKGLDKKDPFRHVTNKNIVVYKNAGQLYSFIEDLKTWWERLHWNFTQASLTKQSEVLVGFPRNYKNCSSFYGRTCPYLDYCHSHHLNILKSVIKNNYQPLEFVINHWNPLEGLKTSLDVERII